MIHEWRRQITAVFSLTWKRVYSRNCNNPYAAKRVHWLYIYIPSAVHIRWTWAFP